MKTVKLTWVVDLKGRLEPDGYYVYCDQTNPEVATPIKVGRGTIDPATNVEHVGFDIAGFPDGTYYCQVTSYRGAEESRAEEWVRLFRCERGICDAIIAPPLPTCVQAVDLPRYTVIENLSRADGARPMYRLKDPTKPYSDTNGLIPLGQYVLPQSLCEPTPVVRQTAAGLWLYTTNAQGVRGISLCRKQ